MRYCTDFNKRLFLTIIAIFLFSMISCTLCADIMIDELRASEIVKRLHSEKVVLFPRVVENGDVVIAAEVCWNTDSDLFIQAKGDIIFKQGGKFVSKGNGSIFLKAGMGTDGRGSIIFGEEDPQIDLEGNGRVTIYYDPKKRGKHHKYHSGQSFAFSQHIKASSVNKIFSTYMLVNDVQDLQDINMFLSGNYALSQNIDAAITRKWNDGQGFEPLRDATKDMPFSGNFNGNGYDISGLFIKRPKEDRVGLFGACSGFEHSPNVVENLVLRDFDIEGDHYVGPLAGWVTYTDISNVSVINPLIKSRDVVGGLVGSVYRVKGKNVNLEQVDYNKITSLDKHKGIVSGGINKSEFLLKCNSGMSKRELLVGAEGYDVELECIEYDSLLPIVFIENKFSGSYESIFSFIKSGMASADDHKSFNEAQRQFSDIFSQCIKNIANRSNSKFYEEFKQGLNYWHVMMNEINSLVNKHQEWFSKPSEIEYPESTKTKECVKELIVKLEKFTKGYIERGKPDSSLQNSMLFMSLLDDKSKEFIEEFGLNESSDGYELLKKAVSNRNVTPCYTSEACRVRGELLPIYVLAEGGIITEEEADIFSEHLAFSIGEKNFRPLPHKQVEFLKSISDCFPYFIEISRVGAKVLREEVAEKSQSC